MIKVVIDNNVSRADIESAIEKYRQNRNMPEEIIIISKDEFDALRPGLNHTNNGSEVAIIVSSKEEYDAEQAQRQLDNIIAKADANINIKMLDMSPLTNIEMYQGRTTRQKKEQDKWRRRYYNR